MDNNKVKYGLAGLIALGLGTIAITTPKHEHNLESYCSSSINHVNNVSHISENKRGVCGSDMRHSSYSLDDLELDSKSALDILSEKENLYRGMIFDLEENKGDSYFNLISGVGNVVAGGMEFKGEMNRQKNRRDCLRRRSCGTRIENYPSDEVRDIADAVGDISYVLNHLSNTQSKIKYLESAIDKIDETQNYIENELASCIKSGNVDSALKSKLFVINSKENDVKMSVDGLSYRHNSHHHRRGLIRRGRFTY